MSGALCTALISPLCFSFISSHFRFFEDTKLCLLNKGPRLLCLVFLPYAVLLNILSGSELGHYRVHKYVSCLLGITTFC